MRKLFLITFVLLLLSSVGIYLARPERQTTVPVLYWVTDRYPARLEQVDMFHQWLIKQGHTTPDGQPACEIRIDSSNKDLAKLMIQGVTGVCGDLIDMPGAGIHFLQQAGLLRDLTDDAKRMGFDASHTYPVLEPEIVIEGRHYGVQRQAYAYMYVVNNATFKKYGLPLPPLRWTNEEFEAIGRRFVEAANPPGTRQRVFLANEVRAMCLWRSLGASELNETMTRSTLNDPRYVQALKLLKKWADVDRIIPNASDLKSVASQRETQFGDSRQQLFYTGQYAMIGMGRHGLPILRNYGDLELGVAEPPHGGFPNTYAGGAAVVVYAGCKHPEMANLFLKFLTSRECNDSIVENGDGLPPDPKATQSERFRRPRAHPNEWGTHEAFAKAMDIGIGDSYSPFILVSNVYNIEDDARQGYLAGLRTADDTAKLAEDRMNAEILRNIEESPTLKKRYEQAVETQQKIDQLRAAGKPVPIAWISNPFHRQYYQFMGWSQ